MARNRGLKPRSSGQYDNRSHGRREGGGPPDDRTINTQVARVNLVRARWKEGPLIARPWPALGYEDPTQLVPGRKHIDSHGQNHWIVRAPVAKYIGIHEHFTFILYKPWEVETNPEVKKNNPYLVLYRAAKAALKAGNFGPGRKWDADWNKLMPTIGGDDTGGAPMSNPNAVGFFQGEIYANGDKDYIGNDRTLPLGAADGDDLQVVQIAGAAFDRLLDLLDTPKPDAEGDEEKEPWKFFKFGDPTGVPQEDGSVEGGKFIYVFNPKRAKVKDGDKGKIVTVGGQSFMLSRSSWEGKISQTQGYETALASVFKSEDGTKFTPDLDNDRAERVRDTFQFWWDDEESGQKGLLKVPSIEEQCVLIARAFQDVPKLLTYAWGDHDEFLSGEVQDILKQKRTAAMPGDDDERDAARGDDDDDDVEGDDDDDAPKAGKKVRTDPTQKTGKKKPADDEDDDTDGDDDDDADEKPAAGKKGDKKKPAKKDDDEDDDADDDTDAENADDDDAGDDDDDADDTDDTGDDEDEAEGEAEAGDDDDDADDSDDDEAGDDDDDTDEDAGDDDDADDTDDDDAGDDDDDDADAPKPGKKGDKKPAGKADKKPAGKKDDDDENAGYFAEGDDDKKPAGKKGDKKPAAKKDDDDDADDDDAGDDADDDKTASMKKSTDAARDRAGKRANLPPDKKGDGKKPAADKKPADKPADKKADKKPADKPAAGKTGKKK